MFDAREPLGQKLIDRTVAGRDGAPARQVGLESPSVDALALARHDVGTGRDCVGPGLAASIHRDAGDFVPIPAGHWPPLPLLNLSAMAQPRGSAIVVAGSGSLTRRSAGQRRLKSSTDRRPQCFEGPSVAPPGRRSCSPTEELRERPQQEAGGATPAHVTARWLASIPFRCRGRQPAVCMRLLHPPVRSSFAFLGRGDACGR